MTKDGRALTVACVLREGPTYAPEWVHKLRAGVERTFAPERFVCLTDCDVPDVETIALESDLRGWWAKLELFRPDLFEGLVLYLDLDTVVVRDVPELREYAGKFAALRDFYSPHMFASGALLWDADQPTPFDGHPWPKSPDPGIRLDYFLNDAARYPVDLLQDLAPFGFGSYKGDGLQGGPRRFGVVCFHGHPRPSEVVAGWVPEAWGT